MAMIGIVPINVGVLGSVVLSVNGGVPELSGSGPRSRPALCYPQHPRPEQVEGSPAVALALDQLEPRHQDFSPVLVQRR